MNPHLSSRAFHKNPAFAAIAIRANASIFRVANAVLLGNRRIRGQKPPV
jgi:hypothetical protein